MPRRRLLALPSIALATVATAWAAEVGHPAPSVHHDLHLSDDGQQLKARPPAAATLQYQRKATKCDSACPDDPTYVSKIGLACADHGIFQCPMFLILGYDETETAELLQRCPCSCGVDCTTNNVESGANLKATAASISTSTKSPTLKPTPTPTTGQPTAHPTEHPSNTPSSMPVTSTKSPTPKPTPMPITGQPTAHPTEYPRNTPSSVPVASSPTTLHVRFEPSHSTLPPSMTPGSSGSSSSSSGSSNPYNIIDDRSAGPLVEQVGGRSANETVGNDHHGSEKPHMVLTTKQLLIICAGIAGLAFIAGVVFQLARGRSSNGKKGKESIDDEDLVIEVGHDGHRHRKNRSTGTSKCSTTECSSEMASVVEYFTYINCTVKNNRRVLAFEKSSNAWSRRLPFSKSHKARRDTCKEGENANEKNGIKHVDIEAGGQGEFATNMEVAYSDCEGPIPVIFSRNEDKITQGASTVQKAHGNDTSKSERKDNTAATRNGEGKPKGGRKCDEESQFSPEQSSAASSYESEVDNPMSKANSLLVESSAASSYESSAYSHYGSEKRYHHERRRQLDSRRSRRKPLSRNNKGRAEDCGLALGQCLKAEFDSYDTYDDFSALGRDAHLSNAQSTKTYDYSCDYGDDTFDQESQWRPNKAHRNEDRDVDLTLSTRRRRPEEDGTWSIEDAACMPKQNLESNDDKYSY